MLFKVATIERNVYFPLAVSELSMFILKYRVLAIGYMEMQLRKNLSTIRRSCKNSGHFD